MDKRSKIAILGFGVEGRAMFAYLHRHNYLNITVCDRNVALKDEMPDGVSVKLGEKYLAGLEDFEVIFRSPGVRVLEPSVASAKARGVVVSSVTKFFIDHCPCRIVGVTGTKGKGTTSTLIYKMVEKKFRNEDSSKVPSKVLSKNSGPHHGVRKVYLGGNIGEPPINFLDDLGRDDLVVLELSSFQLQDLEKSPHYAVLLNTTEDHLDYHADKDEYLYAKEHLLTHQNKDSVAVLNKDYEYVKYYKPLVDGQLFEVSRSDKVKEGAFIRTDGVICYSYNGKIEEVMRTKEVALIGSHNMENVLPAIVIARALGVGWPHIKAVIRTFKGLPHRLEFVEEFAGIKFYNDSYSTTPLTSMAAVDSFDVPTVLIAGGFDKGLNYEDWAMKILTKPNLFTVVLIGDTAEKMALEIKKAEKKLGEDEGSPTTVLKAKNFGDAVKSAFENCEDGGVVVMSPATSSFGMFKNYKERGERFKEEVAKIRAR